MKDNSTEKKFTELKIVDWDYYFRLTCLIIQTMLQEPSAQAYCKSYRADLTKFCSFAGKLSTIKNDIELEDMISNFMETHKKLTEFLKNECYIDFFTSRIGAPYDSLTNLLSLMKDGRLEEGNDIEIKRKNTSPHKQTPHIGQIPEKEQKSLEDIINTIDLTGLNEINKKTSLVISAKLKGNTGKVQEPLIHYAIKNYHFWFLYSIKKEALLDCLLVKNKENLNVISKIMSSCGPTQISEFILNCSLDAVKRSLKEIKNSNISTEWETIFEIIVSITLCYSGKNQTFEKFIQNLIEEFNNDQTKLISFHDWLLSNYTATIEEIISSLSKLEALFKKKHNNTSLRETAKKNIACLTKTLKGDPIFLFKEMALFLKDDETYDISKIISDSIAPEEPFKQQSSDKLFRNSACEFINFFGSSDKLEELLHFDNAIKILIKTMGDGGSNAAKKIINDLSKNKFFVQHLIKENYKFNDSVFKLFKKTLRKNKSTLADTNDIKKSLSKEPKLNKKTLSGETPSPPLAPNKKEATKETAQKPCTEKKTNRTQSDPKKKIPSPDTALTISQKLLGQAMTPSTFPEQKENKKRPPDLEKKYQTALKMIIFLQEKLKGIEKTISESQQENTHLQQEKESLLNEMNALRENLLIAHAKSKKYTHSLSIQAGVLRKKNTQLSLKEKKITQLKKDNEKMLKTIGEKNASFIQNANESLQLTKSSLETEVKNTQLEIENKSLEAENEALRIQNEQLKNENLELRKKLEKSTLTQPTHFMKPGGHEQIALLPLPDQYSSSQQISILAPPVEFPFQYQGTVYYTNPELLPATPSYLQSPFSPNYRGNIHPQGTLNFLHSSNINPPQPTTGPTQYPYIKPVETTQPKQPLNNTLFGKGLSKQQESKKEPQEPQHQQEQMKNYQQNN